MINLNVTTNIICNYYCYGSINEQQPSAILILKIFFNYQLESFILKSPRFVRNVQMQNYLGNELVPTLFILEGAWKAFGQILL